MRLPESLCPSPSTAGGRRQNTILVKVPGPEDSQEDAESGSEASDSVSNSGQAGSQNANNVTVITLNSEGGLQDSLLFFILFSFS